MSVHRKTLKFKSRQYSQAHAQEEMEIRGRDMVSGLPRTITVNSEEIEGALT